MAIEADETLEKWPVRFDCVVPHDDVSPFPYAAEAAGPAARRPEPPLRGELSTRLRIRRASDGPRGRGRQHGDRRRWRPSTPATQSEPATATDPANGSFDDEIDPEMAPIIREVFERIADGEPVWAVADRLSSIDVP